MQTGYCSFVCRRDIIAVAANCILLPCVLTDTIAVAADCILLPCVKTGYHSCCCRLYIVSVRVEKII